MRVTKADRRAKSRAMDVDLKRVNPLYGQGVYDTHGAGLPTEQAKALTKNYRVPHGTGRLTIAPKRHKLWSQK
jgi:hypothetical protein